MRHPPQNRRRIKVRYASALVFTGLVFTGLAFTGLFALAAPGAAHAQAAPDPARPEAEPSWQSSITLGAQVETGVVGNFGHPANGQNFGQLFSDHANQLQLNQILLTAERDLEPKAEGYDIGFKLQLLYGSDARFTHFLGELDRLTDARYQLDVVEANVTLHVPWLTAEGIDIKAGQYGTPLGYEQIDPAQNPFYSRSYIFNFGLPLKHTGVLTVTHVNPTLDAYLGVDSGVNTTVGAGDNNTAPAGLFGVALNLFDGKLSVLALSHIGPETPSLVTPKANSYMRSINDAVVTYKATDKLSLTTELNYIRDDFAHADGYGAAQYVKYNLTDALALNARAEIWRDNKGFYVSAYPANLGFVQAEAGDPATVITAAPTTYSEITLGVTWKPPLPSGFGTLLLRPEIRYDRSLNGTQPYNGGRDRGVFTIAADAILTF